LLTAHGHAPTMETQVYTIAGFGSPQGGPKVEIRKHSLAGVPLLEIEDDIDHSWAEVFDQAIKGSLQDQEASDAPAGEGA
jgi:hypothetical protein